MIKALIRDKFGNEIYITKERWIHIIEGHCEMREIFKSLIKTIRAGKRRRDRENPQKFLYTRKFKHLPPKTVLVVIVKFDFIHKAGKNVPNNFVLSAYLKHQK